MGFHALDRRDVPLSTSKEYGVHNRVPPINTIHLSGVAVAIDEFDDVVVKRDYEYECPPIGEEMSYPWVHPRVENPQGSFT